MNETEPGFPQALVKKLREAQKVAVLTGAGISAESGVPTFRDAQTGLWARYRAEDLATEAAFTRDPKLVWDWYAWRRELTAQAQPNPGHLALVEIERRIPDFVLITQNVDGLHVRAGSQNVVELHGNIQRVKCFNEGTVVEHWEERGDPPPRCPHCGGLLRPDVVWFGENLPAQALETAWEAAQTCDVFFSVGTSALVQPAASLPHVALSSEAAVVEVNPNETPLTARATYVLPGPAGEILPRLVHAVWGI